MTSAGKMEPNAENAQRSTARWTGDGNVPSIAEASPASTRKGLERLPSVRGAVR